VTVRVRGTADKVPSTSSLGNSEVVRNGEPSTVPSNLLNCGVVGSDEDPDEDEGNCVRMGRGWRREFLVGSRADLVGVVGARCTAQDEDMVLRDKRQNGHQEWVVREQPIRLRSRAVILFNCKRGKEVQGLIYNGDTLQTCGKLVDVKNNFAEQL
jgi:hypothetical protein